MTRIRNRTIPLNMNAKEAKQWNKLLDKCQALDAAWHKVDRQWGKIDAAKEKELQRIERKYDKLEEAFDQKISDADDRHEAAIEKLEDFENQIWERNRKEMTKIAFKK
jgi:hypothetical protein